mgnify:FL=1
MRYKKLPGINHGSADDSPANYLDSNIEGTQPNVASLMGATGAPTANQPGIPKLGADIVALQEKVDELKEEGVDSDTAVDIAEDEVTRGMQT